MNVYRMQPGPFWFKEIGVGIGITRRIMIFINIFNNRKVIIIKKKSAI